MAKVAICRETYRHASFMIPSVPFKAARYWWKPLPPGRRIPIRRSF